MASENSIKYTFQKVGGGFIVKKTNDKIDAGKEFTMVFTDFSQIANELKSIFEPRNTAADSIEITIKKSYR